MRDHEFWPRDPDDEGDHPPDELDGDEHSAPFHWWRAHLEEAISELRVAEASALASGERQRLDDAVDFARTLGGVLERGRRGGGMSKQRPRTLGPTPRPTPF